jgi:hypothetical protein
MRPVQVIRPLVHLTLRLRGKQQSAIERLPETASRLNVSTQIGDDDLLGGDAAILLQLVR